jgi:hypothetical protein
MIPPDAGGAFKECPPAASSGSQARAQAKRQTGLVRASFWFILMCFTLVDPIIIGYARDPPPSDVHLRHDLLRTDRMERCFVVNTH